MLDASEAGLPPSLKTWLDEGCDLTVVPDLESYARVILIARHRATQEQRDQLAGHFMRHLVIWLNGESVESPTDGRMVEPSLANIRHAMWMVQGLTDMEVAERFEAALPEQIRAVVHERISEVGDWPLGRS